VTTLDDVVAAAARIAPHVVRTPLLAVPGRNLWVKPECGQPTGSFKVRGAVHALGRLRGVPRVVAQSSGNHGRAIAHAAALSGMTATIVMPRSAPALKVAAVRALGAQVVLTSPADRASTAARLAAGAVLVGADDPDVLAGHGTVGLEILADLTDVAAVAVPVGNGGLLAGVAVAVKALSPGTAVIGVEPELAADAAESLRTGHRVAWPTAATYRTIADGLRVPTLGPVAWSYIRSLVDDIVTVTEPEIAAAASLLWTELALRPEPSGAVATAAHLAGHLPAGRCVTILSGGNIADPDFAELLANAGLSAVDAGNCRA
jgi:threonine dehydratase